MERGSLTGVSKVVLAALSTALWLDETVQAHLHDRFLSTNAWRRIAADLDGPEEALRRLLLLAHWSR